MKMEELISLLGADWTVYKDLVRGALHSDIELLEEVNSSLLLNSGKQLRPILSLLIARACGTPNSDSLRYAVATELLHNATLLHDDVADKSSIRRGKPTLSALMGPSAAVLVGDFWLARAVGMILGTDHGSQAIGLFAQTLSDLAEGEMLQLQKAATADTTEEDYLRIVFCKTASLFQTSCSVAAVSVNASPALNEAACRFGRACGIAFQIRDDIFDYWDEAAIGKPVGLDLKEQKITMPLLGALKNAPDERQIREMVRNINEKPENCGQLHRFVLENGGVEYASGRLDDFINEALAALECFPASKERDALADLARYNAVRKK